MERRNKAILRQCLLLTHYAIQLSENEKKKNQLQMLLIIMPTKNVFIFKTESENFTLFSDEKYYFENCLKIYLTWHVINIISMSLFNGIPNFVKREKLGQNLDLIIINFSPQFIHILIYRQWD